MNGIIPHAIIDSEVRILEDLIMKDTIRESLSYWSLYGKMLRVKKEVKPRVIPFGSHKHQYFLYYEPENLVSDKVILWVHGGGWNAGTPRMFDFVGQCVAKNGYRFISIGYRLSPKYKYPCQIEDVCAGYKASIEFLTANGIDTNKIIVSGPSAGAHLSAILCYSKGTQEENGIDISNVIGFIGVGGPYLFSGRQSLSVSLLLNQLFDKGYDRTLGEPYSLLAESHIPMLLIQSRHDGLIEYSCAEHFYEKAKKLGIECELYTVADQKNTHSWYTAGMFLETREENQSLNQFFSWIEKIG